MMIHNILRLLNYEYTHLSNSWVYNTFYDKPGGSSIDGNVLNRLYSNPPTIVNSGCRVLAAVSDDSNLGCQKTEKQPNFVNTISIQPSQYAKSHQLRLCLGVIEVQISYRNPIQ